MSHRHFFTSRLHGSLLLALPIFTAIGCGGAASVVSSDKTPPTVVSTGPAADATGIAPGRAVTVSFSEALRPLTVNELTFSVRAGTTPVPGTIDYYGTTAVFTPFARFGFATEHTVTLTAGIEDLAGNPLASDISWRFTTGAAIDTASPTVLSTSPADGATEIPRNAPIRVSFSELIDPTTVSPRSFLVRAGADSITGTFNREGAKVTFTPSIALLPQAQYSVTLSRAISDVVGNPLAGEVTFNFVTGVATDTVAPTVIATNPQSGGAPVAANTLISATFSEDMDATTIDPGSMALSVDGTTLQGRIVYADRRAIYTPTELPLRSNATYTAVLSSSAKDIAGNALVPVTWTFTTGPATDTTPPLVTATLPERNAVGIAPNSAISATFSEAMDPTTLSATTMSITAGTTPIAGGVTYAGRTVTFAPSSPLRASTRYTARIGTGARDAAGNGLPETYSWSFTTGAAVDTTAPRVSATSPVDTASDVPVSRLISVVFSEPVSAATVDAQSVQVLRGAERVAGGIAVSGATVTFAPTSPLENDTLYAVLVTTAVRDAAGNALPAEVRFTFRTVRDLAPPRVDSTTPTSDATNVAQSAPIVVTFSEPVDPASVRADTVFVSTGGALVSGILQTDARVVRFVPASPWSLDTLYTVTLTSGIADLSGNALPVVYSWRFSTELDRTAPTVTLVSPLPDATEISRTAALTVTFSESMDETTFAQGAVTLAQGATDVAIAVGYDGRTLTIVPLSPLTHALVYTLTLRGTLADLAGNALGADFTSAFTIVPDRIAPVIADSFPQAGATGVDLGAVVRVTFSEVMSPPTISGASIVLQRGAVAVPGVVTFGGQTATLTPTAPLEYGTVYTTTVTTGVRDAAGNGLASPATFSFTTLVDVRPPAVATTTPLNSATGIARAANVRATFTRPIDAATVTPLSFVLQVGGTPVGASVTFSSGTATLTPTVPLAFSTTYLATLTTAIKDTTGNALVASHSWSFETENDTADPTVTGATPPNGSQAIPVSVRPTATFSKPLDPLTVNSQTFTLQPTGGPVVPASVAYEGGVATLTPLSPLAQDAAYTLRITTGVTDLAGNALPADHTSVFTTAADVTPPSVRARSPEPGATGVPLSVVPRVNFSEYVDSGLDVLLYQGATVLATNRAESADSTGFSVTPQQPLDNSTVYTVSVVNVLDGAGNALADFSWSFTTVADTVPPTVTSLSPFDGQQFVQLNAVPSVFFSEAMNAASVQTAFTLTQNGAPVAGTVAYATGAGQYYATFTPSAQLLPNTDYVAAVTVAARDSHNVPLQSPTQWTFRTVDRQWRTGVAVNAGFSVNIGPLQQLGIDSSNNVMVVWQHRSGGDNIHARRITPGASGGVLQSEVVLGANALGGTALAVSPGGTAVALWLLANPMGRYGVKASRFTNATHTSWTPSVFIDFGNADPPISAVNIDSWRVAMNAAGAAIAVWGQRTGGVSQVWHNRMTSTGVWGTATVLTATTGREGYDPRIALDTAGNALLIYREVTVAGSQVMARRFTAAASTWSAPEAVSPFVVTLHSPYLSMNAAGTASVTWISNDAVEGFQGVWTVRKVSPLLSGVFGTPRLLDSVTPPDGGSITVLTNPRVSVNATGETFASWSRSTNGPFAQQWGTYSSQYIAGTGWQFPLQVRQSQNTTEVALATSAQGVGYVAMALGHIYAARHLPGQTIEPATQLAIANVFLSHGASSVSLGVYPNGNAIAVWSTFHSTSGQYVWFAEYN